MGKRTSREAEIDRQIGERLRTLRMAKGLSQEALAEQIGVSFQQLQKYEKGTNRIGGSKLFRISRAMGVSCEAFFGEGDAGFAIDNLRGLSAIAVAGGKAIDRLPPNIGRSLVGILVALAEAYEATGRVPELKAA